MSFLQTMYTVFISAGLQRSRSNSWRNSSWNDWTGCHRVCWRWVIQARVQVQTPAPTSTYWIFCSRGRSFIWRTRLETCRLTYSTHAPQFFHRGIERADGGSERPLSYPLWPTLKCKAGTGGISTIHCPFLAPDFTTVNCCPFLSRLLSWWATFCNKSTPQQLDTS